MIEKPKVLCKDCKYFKQRSLFNWCIYRKGEITGYSAITGKPILKSETEAVDMRFGWTGASGKYYNGECGPDGLLFERKIPITEKVVQFFKKVLE